MCAYSMTGFGRGEAKGRQYQLVTEIKSVNHRFKDFRFKMPSLFSSQELDLREALNHHFVRGSFEITLNSKKLEDGGAAFDLDEKKIASFIAQIQKITDPQKVSLVSRPVDFLRSEFFIDDEEMRKKELQELLKKAFWAAIQELKNSRKGEGTRLVTIIKNHLDLFEKNFNLVLSHMDTYQKDIHEKLLKKLTTLVPDLEADQGRLRQEIVYYMDKLDVEEETNRIKVHLDKVRQILGEKEEVGRNIDFLVQELNRETNTIGSKTGSIPISEAVVQMKVQLEKIREQALNLE